MSPEQVELFNKNKGLAYYFSNKFYLSIQGSNEYILEKDDIDNIGLLGLVKAIKTYNPDLEVKLASYASRVIHNEFLMALRRYAYKADAYLEDVSKIIGNKNSDKDLVNVYDLIEDTSARVEDVVESRADCADKNYILLKVYSKMKESRSKRIISCYLQNPDVTQWELAVKFGLSQSYISRVLNRFRNKINKEYDKSFRSA